jgi:membrane protease subunit HflK
VQAARIDAERAQNEAQTYANRIIPESRGRVAQITQAAEAYREQTVAEATGQASRFLKIYDQYKNAPEVTRQRMYLETMERLFGGTDKIIVDTSKNAGRSGVVPYLPLNELRPQTQTEQQMKRGCDRPRVRVKGCLAPVPAGNLQISATRPIGPYPFDDSGMSHTCG